MNPYPYLVIDLKSFYASVECVERGLDPMAANLVVADPKRSAGTLCLAITPSMKRLGISNRCRLYEIPNHISYLVAEPRMKLYLDYSAKIYGIYLKYISKEDIHVYSIDEAFLDVSDYLSLYHMTSQELAQVIMKDIMDTTGIRATCGIGTNLYLAKVALDITAKHADDFIGCLDEKSYCDTLWDHRPLTDFWRIGEGTAKTLKSLGIMTMGELAHFDENILYDMFGIDAELLIDHAWGREPVTISDIKAYTPKSRSLSSGQVLMKDYSFENGKLIVKEMMDLLCLDMVQKNLVTNSVSLHVGYSHTCPVRPSKGTASLPMETNADSIMIPSVIELYEHIVDPRSPIRRINISCNHVIPEKYHQYSLFDSDKFLERNRRLQKAVLEIKSKYGKNAILKGMDLMDSATTIQRNHQIGGHKSGE